jgi:putative SOS response-associated peptidase YedK
VFTKQFNIGEEQPTGKTKQWICNRPDNEPVAIAVIFNAWELVQGPLRAFAMVTTASCAPLSEKAAPCHCRDVTAVGVARR